ncbi:hypothetical protein P7K49_011164, partial [Saguinus oedipus]
AGSQLLVCVLYTAPTSRLVREASTYGNCHRRLDDEDRQITRLMSDQIRSQQSQDKPK